MTESTRIEWTDSTWNPVSGCSPASPGCDHCYARGIAGRFPAAHAPGRAFEEVVCHPERLDIPLRWRRPRFIFVASMGDLFHRSVPDDFRFQVFAVMALARHHTFQVLTKRPARALEWFSTLWGLERTAEDVARTAAHIGGIVWDGRGSDPVNYYSVCGPMPTPEELKKRRVWPGWPLPNVWIGVTAEDQARADERVPLLLQIPAALRFVSVEPMLGPVCLEAGFSAYDKNGEPSGPRNPMIDWVICGGETGAGARPMLRRWGTDLRDQCRAVGVPFFFKKMGAGRPTPADLAVREWPTTAEVAP